VAGLVARDARPGGRGHRRGGVPVADANGLPVPPPSHAASTAYRLALASLVCGIVPLGLGLISIASHKYSGFFLLGWVPAFAAINIGALQSDNSEKRISRISRYAFWLGLFGFAAVTWAAGYDYDWGGKA